MDSAVEYGMTRTLACCEHCIAWDDSGGKYDEILHRLPSTSVVRIMASLREMRDEAYPVCHSLHHHSLQTSQQRSWVPEKFLDNKMAPS